MMTYDWAVLRRTGYALVIFLATECVVRAAEHSEVAADKSRLERRNSQYDFPQPKGRLGYLLGTELAIEGVWEQWDALDGDSPLRFRVTQIEGKATEQPLDFHEQFVRSFPQKMQTPRAGERWKVTAVEAGGLRRKLPREMVLDYIRNEMQGVPEGPVDFQVVTELVWSRSERIENEQ